jgi:hypothetical protein
METGSLGMNSGRLYCATLLSKKALRFSIIRDFIVMSLRVRNERGNRELCITTMHYRYAKFAIATLRSQ